jgi:serine protease Do
MKKLFLTLLLSFTISNANAAPAPEGGFADLVEKLSPAVVNISTTQMVKGFNAPEMGGPAFPPGSPFEEFNGLFEQQFKLQQQQQAKPKKATSLGSGFIIDSKGIIITNNHVVEGGTDITVILHDNTELKAKVIGTDKKVDIAVLKVEAGKPLPFVSFGNSEAARVGDWVIAIGNPYGLGGSVSAGIVSARGRDINIGQFDDFLQTDAAINRGNSGGPMFNMNGEVIGINTAIFSPGGNTGGNVGIGFAMPETLVKPVIDQILKYGKAKRAWLGVKIQPITSEIANSLGLKQEQGALVLGVTEGGPAAKAGIKQGDVILSFDGKKVEAMKKLPRIVAETEIGKQVQVEIFRNGQTMSSTATLTEMKEEEEADATDGKAAPDGVYVEKSRTVLGMKLIEINPSTQRAYKVALAKGLLVAAVDPSGKAAEYGLREGDVVTQAGQAPIAGFNDLDNAIKQAVKAGKNSVLLMVTSGKESRFVGLPIK